MRLDSALSKSRPRYISAQTIWTLFDALDEREIAWWFSDLRAFMAAPVSYYASVSELFMVYNVYLGFFDKHGCTYWWIKKQSAHCKHVPCSTLTHSTNDDLLSIKRKGDPKSRTLSCTSDTTERQALVSFKKYMPPPLPYFKVNICPFLLPHFASIFFAYLWSFRWPNCIVTLPRYFSFQLPHLNIPTGPPQTNWTRINSERGLVKISVIETDTATSGLRWIFHMHSEFSRPAMCKNAIMIISSQI